MNYSTPTLAKHVADMGSDLGTFYDALWQEVCRLHIHWKAYVEVYGTRPERIDLLNQTAGQFFRICGDAMWRDTLLHISRFLDPPKMWGKKGQGPKYTLSLRALPELIDRPAVRASVEQLIAKALVDCDFAIQIRHSQLAHTERDVALAQTVVPLPGASRAQVHTALASLADVLNAISEGYGRSTLNFDFHPTAIGAKQLLYALTDAVEVMNARDARIRAHQPLESDFHRPEI